MRSFSAFAALIASASVAQATVNIHNYCSENVYVRNSHNGACDMGADTTKCFSAPWVIAPGATTPIPMYSVINQGTSVKIATSSSFSGILQFEYTPNDNMYWDLSDLDGKGAARVGSPFASDNIRVTPVGTGVGQGTCTEIKCAANVVCKNAYQSPDQVATHACPKAVTTFNLDLCVPSAQFTKRTIGFSA